MNKTLLLGIFSFLLFNSFCFTQEVIDEKQNCQKNLSFKNDSTISPLSKREAKKIAKIFLRKNRNFVTYMKFKPYKAQRIGEYWYFHGKMLFSKKPRRGGITARVNVYNGSTDIILRK